MDRAASEVSDAIEWGGASLDELVAHLSGQALAARIQVRGDDGKTGEVHLLAGGVAEALAGERRGDEAMAALRVLPGARYLVEPRLPDPASGALEPPGPRQGSLAERGVAALMRYCEDYVLTCTIEATRERDRASIEYRRGEIAVIVVNGSESADALPEVMTWTTGSYRLVLPPLSLPPAPVVAAAPPAHPVPVPRASEPAPPLAEPAPRRRGFADLPLPVHAAIGVGIGLAIVAAYWATQIAR